VENEPIKIGAGVNSFFRNFLIIAKKMIFRGKKGLRAGVFPGRREKSLRFFATIFSKSFLFFRCGFSEGAQSEIFTGIGG
jgi:hypothetical protein